MKILHPNNNKYCSLDELNQYYSNGYYSIISSDEKEELHAFLEAFEDYRKSTNTIITDPVVYKNLPFSINDITWRERQKDVKIINKLISNKNSLRILDVGSWNGWLCNYLTQKGHHLTGLNFFTDEFDGLKTHKYYDTTFTLLQMHVDQLFRIQQKFDLIVFNRNWAFFKDHKAIINDAKKILNPNGQILFTGLAFYKNPVHIKQQFETKNINFQKLYNMPLFYKVSKGFLDFNDKSVLKSQGIALHSYHKFNNVVKFFFMKKPVIYFGLFANKMK